MKQKRSGCFHGLDEFKIVDMRFQLKDTFGVFQSKQNKITTPGESAIGKTKVDQQSGRHLEESQKRKIGEKLRKASSLGLD